MFELQSQISKIVINLRVQNEAVMTSLGERLKKTRMNSNLAEIETEYS